MRGMKWHPGLLLETSNGYWKACTLHAAVKGEVFSALGDDERPARELAQKLSADPRGLTMLLNALTAMDLLEKRGQGFANTPFSRRYLCRDSADYLGHIIMHHHFLMPSWNQLDRAVLRGEPVRHASLEDEPERRKSFLMGMTNSARSLGSAMLHHLDFSAHQRLLDLGGGPGAYAVIFCKAYPGLEALVFDLPTTQPLAAKYIQAQGMEDRIQFHAGDYLTDPIPGRHDLIWMSHILHAEGPEAAQGLVKKAAKCLEPGGCLLIHEFILDESQDQPLFPALFSLNMLVGTPQGQAYTESQIRGMMEAAGLVHIRRLPFLGPTASAILCGYHSSKTGEG